MLAAWYERQGPAADVLVVGELADPAPGPGEVRIRVRASGINPGDIKKREGWLGSSMPYSRVIPHSRAPVPARARRRPPRLTAPPGRADPLLKGRSSRA